MIILHVLLGARFFKDIVPNPMVSGTVVAVNMIIIVLTGILFGKEVGLTVGFMGTLTNAFVTGSAFEFATVIPHGIMGYLAGYPWQKRGILFLHLQ